MASAPTVPTLSRSRLRGEDSNESGSASLEPLLLQPPQAVLRLLLRSSPRHEIRLIVVDRRAGVSVVELAAVVAVLVQIVDAVTLALEPTQFAVDCRLVLLDLLRVLQGVVDAQQLVFAVAVIIRHMVDFSVEVGFLEFLDQGFLHLSSQLVGMFPELGMGNSVQLLEFHAY